MPENELKLKFGKRNRVAAIMTGAWGDLYVSTAAVKEAFAQFSDCEAWVVGSERWLDIMSPEVWNGLSGIIVSKDGWQGTPYHWNSQTESWAAYKDNVSLLKFYKTCAATFNFRTESLRYAWAPFLSRVPVRHGSAPKFWEWLYTECAPWLGKDPLIHERDRFLQVVEGKTQPKKFSKNWRKIGLPALAKPNRKAIESHLGEDSNTYWLINPTSSRREKAWPASKFRQLIIELQPHLSSQKIKILVVGAPTEREWLEEVAPEGIKIIQPNRISELMNLVANSNLLITNTSSMQFLAIGFGVQLITLVGNAKPEIWGPLGENSEYVKVPIKKPPEADIFELDRKSYEAIPVELVLRHCLAKLTKSQNKTD